MDAPKWSLQKIGEVLAVHTAREEEMWRQIETLKQEISDIKKRLFVGNGVPPLVQEVRNNSEWIRGVNKYVYAIILAVITQIIGLVCSSSISILYFVSKFINPQSP